MGESHLLLLLTSTLYTMGNHAGKSYEEFLREEKESQRMMLSGLDDDWSPVRNEIERIRNANDTGKLKRRKPRYAEPALSGSHGSSTDATKRRLAEILHDRQLEEDITTVNVLTAAALSLGLGLFCVIRRCFRKKSIP